MYGGAAESLSLFRIRAASPHRLDIVWRPIGRPDRREGPDGKTGIGPSDVPEGMCQYCSYARHDGWTRLLEYDDVYQNAFADRTDQSTHGFHESWDDLRDELEL
ncbi:hypothetical protein SAMN04488556_3453 [Halostagnicola kamekurae]|uniref:Uncharacterized protein n=2 Tax=Halostagnicola kamekurae TaxID=619731 RepID=A0A1I6TUJ4_9EURY|nr:hypothetical protein SAMN04488556_3453 [Halostagnicola kamekurae]